MDLPNASKKKEAALARLEAAHQDILQDRWHMEGQDSEEALPTQVKLHLELQAITLVGLAKRELLFDTVF